MTDAIVVIGAGSIGFADERRWRFITGSDFLMDGGVTASYWFGELAPR